LGYHHLLEAIGGRDVIIDECFWAYGFPDFLDSRGINWRRFPSGTPDQAIMELRNPNEVIVTTDKKMAHRLGNRAILIPYTGGPNQRYTDAQESKRRLKALETEEMLRDWEMKNDVRFNILRGMRMLFCKRVEGRTRGMAKYVPI